ncbi:MAG: hypothetical protein GVY26_08760 [Bacteroidetes bacterium]|jgi:hypothetical protein|nr:hypothetical protein [Bacteroidota bacterium]
MKGLKLIFPVFVMLFLLAAEDGCAQAPKWVANLTKNVFSDLDVDQITHWEERQMTWYHVNDAADGSDSLKAPTLYVEGTTRAGKNFIGAIPIAGQEHNPLGTQGIAGQSCTGESGCQCCKFTENDYGCYCDKDRGSCCEDQGPGNGNCWCKHTKTIGRERDIERGRN